MVKTIDGHKTAPILCRIGVHKMSAWQIHPHYGYKETRSCVHCGWIEDRNAWDSNRKGET